MANVRYMVSDTELAVAFYTEHLGFLLKKNFGRFAMVTLGDLTLWLSDPKTSARKPMSDGREAEPGGWNRIVVDVDDLESTVESMIIQPALPWTSQQGQGRRDKAGGIAWGLICRQ